MQVTSPYDIKQSLDSLADKVAPIDAPAADRLRDLSYAVMGGPNADAWASSNLHHLIDPHAITERLRSRGTNSRLYGILEWARNGLVLLPLMITWLAISLAVSSYQDYLSDAPPEVADQIAAQPFLYLWEQGFGGRVPELLRLGPIALGDFFLILLIVIITMIVHRRSNYTQIARDTAAEQLQLEMEHTLANASLLLAAQKSQQPINLVKHFDMVTNQLLGELAAERKRLSELAARREKELQDLSAATATFGTSAQTISTAAQQMAASHNAFTQNVGALRTWIENLGQSIVQSTGIIKGALDNFAQQQQSLFGATQSVANNLSSIDTKFAQITNELQNSLPTLEIASTNASDAANNIAAITKLLVGGQTTFLEALEKDRQVQTTLATNVLNSTGGLEHALTQVKTASVALHGIAVDLSQLLQLLPSSPVGLRDEVHEMIKQNYAAATNLSSAGAALSNAALSIDLASQNLTTISAQMAQPVATP